MPDVKMPDGTIIRDVPDGTTRAQLMGRYEKMRAADNGPEYNKSRVSQFLSGANEGVAMTLGAPVDIANSILSLGARGINAVTGSNLKVSDNPLLGGGTFKGAMESIGSIGPQTSDTVSRFVRRVGQSVGSAAVPVAATANTPVQVARALAPAVTGGAGAATAREIFPGNPWAELGGEILGGGAGLGSVHRSMRRAARRKAADAVPSIPKLKEQADAMYDLAEANGVTASQQQTTDLASRFKGIAQDEGLISPTGRVSSAYPKAKEALDLASDYSSGAMSPKQMKTVRKVLSEAAGSSDNSERRIARAMLEEFDNWSSPLAPEFAQARSIASKYINAGKIQDAIERAGSKAGQYSGSGFENALRTEFRALDRKIINGQERGFRPEVAKAIRDVSRGTPASNVARNVGKLAPTGVVSASLGTGVPFAIGTSVGGPGVGAALSGLTGAAGVVGRNTATRMGINNANLAELIARNGGAVKVGPTLSNADKRWIAALAAGQLGQHVPKNKKKNPN